MLTFHFYQLFRGYFFLCKNRVKQSASGHYYPIEQKTIAVVAGLSDDTKTEVDNQYTYFCKKTADRTNGGARRGSN